MTPSSYFSTLIFCLKQIRWTGNRMLRRESESNHDLGDGHLHCSCTRSTKEALIYKEHTASKMFSAGPSSIILGQLYMLMRQIDQLL